MRIECFEGIEAWQLARDLARRVVTTQVQSSKVHGSEINLSTVNREL